MRKIAIVILLFLTLVLAGCFGKPQQPGNQNQNINPTPTTTEEIDTSDWKTYRNEEYGFEFKYPGEFYINCDNCSYPVLCKKFDDKEYCFEAYLTFSVDGEGKDFKTYAASVAKNFCASDGPMGSSHCDKILEQTLYQTNGINGYKITLEETNENYLNNTIAKRENGPIYIFDLPKVINSRRAIMFHLLFDRVMPKKEINNSPIFYYYSQVLELVTKTFRFI